jgi:hypothetical protein
MTFNPTSTEIKSKLNSSAVPELSKMTSNAKQSSEMKVPFGKQLSNQDNSLNFSR